MPAIRPLDRTPAQPNCWVSDFGRATQLGPAAPRKFAHIVKLADAITARAQWRAVRLPSLDDATDYMQAAALGIVPTYDCMDGLPRLPLVRL